MVCYTRYANFTGRSDMAARKKTTARKQSAASKSASSRRAPEATALLRADHQAVQKLFDQFEKTRSEDRKGTLAQQICEELTIHARIEEEIFYPAAREALREQDLLDEATVEHQGAKDLIAQIEGANPSDDLFDAKVTVLGEYIKHHVKEEQNELFPKIRKTKLDLKELGERMQARKMELMEAGAGAKGGGSSGSKMSGSRSGQRSKGGSKEKEQQSEGIMATMARGIGLGS
jgi:hemerythrin superfamily protein